MTLVTVGLVLVGLPLVLLIASYLGYPLVLLLLNRGKPAVAFTDPPEWPELTISIPVYNEHLSIADTLDNVLSSDYPVDRRHILVISDASTDGTDAIVQRYADRGVKLVRLPIRSGKTAAENEAGHHLVGDLVINMDATIRVPPEAVKELVRAFTDPTVGVASGRDVSVGDEAKESNQDESSYVGYEMWVRRLESQSGSIVGASGCFYGIRRHLFDRIFPAALSRDFASPLIAREAGFRSVSVDRAICLVPRTRSIQAEYRRKVRTMTRGLETLWFKRGLLNPFRHGQFAIFLGFHKLLRWMVFPSLLLAAAGLVMLAIAAPAGILALLLVVLGGLIGAIGYYWPPPGRPPRLFALAGFAVSVHLAGIEAWFRAIRGELNPIWEPTRRPHGSGR